MDIGRYRQFLQEYVHDAIANSDGTNREIREYLSTLEVKGIFVRYKAERKQALADAQKAFIEHRHWPLEIVLSHLGVSPPG